MFTFSKESVLYNIYKPLIKHTGTLFCSSDNKSTAEVLLYNV
jgi:hypothetical protein